MKVTMYSTRTCPFCYMEKRFLKKNKIEFEEINVSKYQDAAREMIEKSGHTGVPQTDIDGKIIVGFNKEALIKELGL
ncbi:MAG: glutaredoxin domain-containing protein [Halobacteriota archaeon]|nr:glutaredoxin domain-containing protein [Halobacteriota archaeon]